MNKEVFMYINYNCTSKQTYIHFLAQYPFFQKSEYLELVLIVNFCDLTAK